MFSGKRQGFTMIEMLTVIAIIGILAAIIFPVIAVARRRAKQTQCVTNMYNIFTAVKGFKLDEHRYPDFIAGPVDPVNPVLLEESTGIIDGRVVSLYPEYIDSVGGLKCPLASIGGDGREYSTDPSNPQDVVVDPMWAFMNHHLVGVGDMVRAKQPYWLYKYCSYDYQKPPRTAADEVHYGTAWCTTMSDPDVKRQLRWRNPPADTVVTWCSFHRSVDATGQPKAGSKDLVLFLDGHVKPMQSGLMMPYYNGWKVPAPK